MIWPVLRWARIHCIFAASWLWQIGFMPYPVKIASFGHSLWQCYTTNSIVAIVVIKRNLLSLLPGFHPCCVPCGVKNFSSLTKRALNKCRLTFNWRNNDAVRAVFGGLFYTSAAKRLETTDCQPAGHNYDTSVTDESVRRCLISISRERSYGTISCWQR